MPDAQRTNPGSIARLREAIGRVQTARRWGWGLKADDADEADLLAQAARRLGVTVRITISGRE